jgi:hypothetical protein
MEAFLTTLFRLFMLLAIAGYNIAICADSEAGQSSHLTGQDNASGVSIPGQEDAAGNTSSSGEAPAGESADEDETSNGKAFHHFASTNFTLLIQQFFSHQNSFFFQTALEIETPPPRHL